MVRMNLVSYSTLWCAVDHEWCEKLPVKVGEGRAAWLCRSSRVIVLRPVHYVQKSVHALLVPVEPAQNAWSHVHCYDVPDFQQVQQIRTQHFHVCVLARTLEPHEYGSGCLS